MTPQEQQSKVERLEKLRRLRDLKAQRAEFEVVSEGGAESHNSGYQYTEADIKRQKQAIEKFQASRPSAMITDPAFERGKDLQSFAPGSKMHELDAFVARGLNSASGTLGSNLAPDNRARELMKRAGEEQPLASTIGDVAGFLVPAAPAFNAATRGIGAVSRAALSSNLGARFIPTGSSLSAQAGRYLPQKVAPAWLAGLGDYAAYEGSVGATNRAATEDRDATLGERIGDAATSITDPWAHVGAAASPIYRTGRAAVTGVKNSIDETIEQGAPRLAPGSFISSQRADEVAKQIDVLKSIESDPKRAKAYALIAKRLDQDKVSQGQLNEALKMFSYGGFRSVDEMLGELAHAATNREGAGQLRQLVVALANVGGDAQSMARKNLPMRQDEAIYRIRDGLRNAAGIKGDDYYQYIDDLEEAGRTLPGPHYQDAYGKSVTDENWHGTVLPLFQTSPSARTAIEEALGYANDTGRLAVAGELDAITQYLDEFDNWSGASGPTASPVSPKLSTEALDFIDRKLGDAAEGIRRAKGRKELAKGPAGAQARLRSVLDPDTGLNKPRDMSHEFFTAVKAIEFGAKAFKNTDGMQFDALQRQFQREVRKFVDDGANNLFEGNSSLINSALLMGWVRGAENKIANATNPGTVIRQLYGSQQQRQKMREMLLGLEDTDLARAAEMQALNPGLTADEVAKQVARNRDSVSTGNSKRTENIRHLIGGKYNNNPNYSHVPEDSPLRAGQFERERDMSRTLNETVGNSQTAPRNEAIAAQGGLQRMAHLAKDVFFNAPKVADQAIDWSINRLTRPAIFDPEVNRQLGDALFQGGKPHLEKVIKELEQYRRFKPDLPQRGAPAASKIAPATSERRPVAAGLPMMSDRTDLGMTGVGAVVGGNVGMDDYNNDGVVDWKDWNTPEGRGAIVSGGVAGFLGSKMGKSGPPRLKPGTMSNGIPGRRLKDVMKDASSNNLPAVRSDLPQIRSARALPPGSLPQRTNGSRMPQVLTALGLGGGAFAGMRYLNQPSASTRNESSMAPADLQSIRQEFMNDYAAVLTNVNARESLIHSRMARVQQIDQLMEREARREGQAPASPEIDRARQEIVDSLLKKIRHAPRTDLSAYYDKLDRIDAIIATGGVPTPRRAGVPPAPSLKPALPQR